MEPPVGVFGHDHIVRILGLHLGDQQPQPIQLLVGDAQGGQGAGLAFDRPPRLQQLERADVGFIGLAARRAPGRDIDARSQPHLHQPVQLQGDDGFAHSGAGHGIGLGQVAFGRQALADGIDRTCDLVGQIQRYALVEPAGFLLLTHDGLLSGHTNLDKPKRVA